MRDRINKSIGINAILNALCNILSIVYPLITFPYVLRVLGVTNIGKINYGNSIVTYFALFASLGISTYAIREGSRIRDSETKINEFVNQIFTINIISTAVSYFLLIILLISIKELNNYFVLIVIQSLTIICSTFSVSWLSSIYEDYLYITIRSIVIYLISIILLFCFIKSTDDYLLYAFMQVVTSAVVALSNWIYFRRYVRVRITPKLSLKRHLRPILILFANSFAITIYVNFDITMLGWIKGDLEVGLYSAAVKIYLIVKNVLMSIYQVTIPRLSFMYGQKNYDKYKELFTNLWGKLTVLLIPMSIGLFVLAPDIMLLIGGEEYVVSGIALRFLCVALVFSIYAGFVSPVLNVTIGKESENLLATIISAVINILLNFYFIFKFSFVGAAFTTVVAEMIAFIFPFIRVKNKKMYLETKRIIQSLIKVLISSAVIIPIYYIVNNITENYIITILLTVPISVCSYLIILIALKEYFVLDILKNNKIVTKLFT